MIDGIKSGYSEFEYQLRVGITAPSGSSSQYGGLGEIQTFYTPDVLTVSQGVYLKVTNETGGGPITSGRTARLDIPALSISQTWSDTTVSSIETYVHFYGCRVIVYPSGVWRFQWTSFEWYVNSVVEYTGSGGGITSAMSPQASAVPLLGIPPLLGVSTNYQPAGTVGCLGDFSLTPRSDNATTTATGGYRIKIDGAWHEAPLSLDSSVPAWLSALGSGSSTWSVSLTANASIVDAATHRQIISENANCWIAPYYPTSLERLNDPYEMLVARWGFPKVQRVDSTTSSHFYCDGGTDTSSTSATTSDITGLDTEFLSTVTEAPHIIENPITRHKYALLVGSKSQIDCYPSDWTQVSDSSAINTSLDTSTMSAALQNSDSTYGWIAMLANTYYSPFSSYYPFFTTSWQLMGADSDLEYWQNKTRQQYMYQVDLPTEEKTKHRTNIVSNPLTQNGVTGVASSLNGGCAFWGVDQLEISGETYPASVTTDSTSADRFTTPTTGGSVAVGTDIVASGGTGPIIVRFAMSDYEAFPYQYPKVCDRVNLTWDTANVDNMKVYAVGVDGTRKLITDDVAGIFAIPRGASSKYATSFGQDFGDPFLTDTYDPVAANDDTAATIADPDRINSFDYLPSDPIYLEFEITRTDDGTDVTVHHPTFYLASLADAMIFYETGRACSILFKDGPGVRFGATSYWNALTDTLLSTPLALDDPDGAPTMGDLWSFENNYFKAKTYDDGLLTRLGNEFVYNEEYTVLKHAWRYSDGEGGLFPDTLGFFVNSDAGPKLAYYSSWRSGMANFWMIPEKKRVSADGWAKTGDYGQYRYSFASSRHPVVVSGLTGTQLIDPLDNDILIFVACPHGWAVGFYQLALENDEGYDYTVRHGGIDWFNIRPWRGLYNVFGGVSTGQILDYSISRAQRHAVATKDAGTGTLNVYFSLTNGPYSWEKHAKTLEIDWARIAYNKMGDLNRLWVLWAVSTDISLGYLDQEAGDVILAISIGSGDFADICTMPNGITWVYRLDGGTVYGAAYDANLDVVVADTATNLTGLDTAQITAEQSVDSTNRVAIGLTHMVSGAWVFKTASDGLTFS
ncbi:MAG: hypothetical protein JST51_01450 [Armatimonadetes bacterium]|nr:hypothetical protein [Armatimonadota bacterium]